MGNSEVLDTSRPIRSKELLRYILFIIAQTGLLGLLLFLAAGQVKWLEGWIFIICYLLSFLIFLIWGVRKDPALLRERARSGSNGGKSWDGIILRIHVLFTLGILVLAGLDQRFGWSTVPPTLQWIAFIVLEFSWFLSHWALRSNPFASGAVRIQEERGHVVSTGGPYRFVRHPMYIAQILYMLVFPIFIDSWWALLIGILDVILFIVRTALEDKTLQTELPGYKAFTRQTRFRLIPGIW
ncbi:MAG: isoprenylcysteine carboxylmethyltransferase family protein [Anaerolineales bacterium]|nr:isoprenylcysteine carboxylmethyltransferase family protein [Anaerolineales bacterium]